MFQLSLSSFKEYHLAVSYHLETTIKRKCWCGMCTGTYTHHIYKFSHQIKAAITENVCTLGILLLPLKIFFVWIWRTCPVWPFWACCRFPHTSVPFSHTLLEKWKQTHIINVHVHWLNYMLFTHVIFPTYQQFSKEINISIDM